MNNAVIEQPQTKLATVGYFERPEINCSGLKLILQSPAHFKHAQTSPRVETKAMQIGTAVHALTLEPVKFAQDYTVLLDDIDKRSKAGKEAWAALEAQNKILLTRDEFEQIKNISEAVKTHPTAEKILEFGFAELEIYTQIQGIPAKAKMDWYRKGIIADLKTTDDSSPEGFARACAKYGYAMQAAWYLDCANAQGMEVREFIFIAVEKSAPYCVGIYTLDDETLERGRNDYRLALAMYQRCLETGVWHGYSTNIETLTLPTWAFKQAA
jgi:hypothetical protein